MKKTNRILSIIFMLGIVFSFGYTKNVEAADTCEYYLDSNGNQGTYKIECSPNEKENFSCEVFKWNTKKDYYKDGNSEKIKNWSNGSYGLIDVISTALSQTFETDTATLHIANNEGSIFLFNYYSTLNCPNYIFKTVTTAYNLYAINGIEDIKRYEKLESPTTLSGNYYLGEEKPFEFFSEISDYIAYRTLNDSELSNIISLSKEYKDKDLLEICPNYLSDDSSSEYKECLDKVSDLREDFKLYNRRIEASVEFNKIEKDSANVKLVEDAYLNINDIYNTVQSKGEPYDGVEGCAVFGESLTPIIKQAIDILQLLFPLILFVMTLVDFLTITLSGEEKTYKSAIDKLIKRIIILAIFEILPMLITLLIGLSGIFSVSSGDLFCSLF